MKEHVSPQHFVQMKWVLMRNQPVYTMSVSRERNVRHYVFLRPLLYTI